MGGTPLHADPTPALPPRPSAYWAGPRHLAGDDQSLYDIVADTLAGLGWTALTIVRGRQEPDDDTERGELLRSTVLHVSPDGLRWAQWGLADQPFLLGEVPIAWQVSARAENGGSADWSAYFTSGLPGEAVTDFVVALDAHDRPATRHGDPEAVLDAVTAHGWRRDATHHGAADPTYASYIEYCEVPPFIQDGDPYTLTVGPDDLGPLGWQAWCDPGVGTPYLWAASFSASAPDDLVAVFAASLSSTRPVLRRNLPESTRAHLLLAPAD
ncbi:DUF317 domain-containing protein [Streptomyces sp. GZWMJZ-114]|uniref:DUF317 domain-containing protein n=1 Tax=Streptomyces sp. GZWMJZ-114 TaxID=2494734 RepID=UPI001F512F0A|nr:DUF317 domain-containing protein [Streptomyces sp. GZWMJZ-114]